MCGICGFYNDARNDLLDNMCGALAHRGPDDQGTFIGGPVGLAMARLKIVDLCTGHQPMSNEDGGITVVFNGEIYNYRELRAELNKKGHRFRTRSDTEVIVHLYEEMGRDCVQKLRGIFAFAVWDGGSLYVARDRLGVKPLYYTWVNDRFYFASEIKALLLVPGVDREVDLEALDDFVALQYVPAPKTLFKGIFKLPGGHWMRINGRGGWVNRYWELPLPYPNGWPYEGSSVREKVGELLADAVRSRTISDVPLGVLLSGGLDSSIVAALLRRNLTGQLKAFHIRFAGEEGEAVFARAVAQALDYEYHELEAGPGDLAAIPKVIWHLDEPIADAAAWATHLICRYVKSHVSVLLTGEGGDEVFAGYPRYLLSRFADLYHYSPPLLKRISARVASAAQVRYPRTRLWRHAVKLANSAGDPWVRNFAWLSIFAEAERQTLYTDDFAYEAAGGRAARLYERYFKYGAGRSNLQRLTAVDMKTWLVDNVLMKVDKTSMSAAVEARVPLLDHMLVETVVRLPDKDRFGRWTPKKLLKDFAGGLLPTSIVHRPKRAFEVPVGKWLREHRREWVCDVLGSAEAVARGYFRPQAVAALLDNFIKTGTDGKKIWSLFCLELWHRQFIDGFLRAHYRTDRLPCVISS
jgi:asparagine synthase (glutamine-hydrolysing)